MTDLEKQQAREIARLRSMITGLEQVIADLRDELAGRKAKCKHRRRR